VTRKNKTYVVKTVTVVSEEELKWMVDLSIKRARLKHKNFCTIRNYEVNKKQDMCSKATVISLYFDYLHNDLEKEIEARGGIPGIKTEITQQYFSEEWIGNTLYSIIECLRYLE
jgi:hypothetical protein